MTGPRLLFADTTNLVHCDNCSFVRDLDEADVGDLTCPVCRTQLQSTRMIVPQVFTPQDARPLPEDDREQEITYATSAQFPVPVGTRDLPDLNQRITDHLSYIITPDRKLVTVNKGQLANEIYQGFSICHDAGAPRRKSLQAGVYRRPYEIEYSYSQPRPARQCNGEFHKVFLGHVFRTVLAVAPAQRRGAHRA